MANVIGNWTIKIDWDCDGVLDGTVTQSFNADGTWEINDANPHKGRWFQNEGLVIWTFDDVPELIYTANVKRKSMEGIQGYTKPEGIKGCFSGKKERKVSDTKAKSSNPAIGK
jgi:hypothetical protein